MARHGRVGPYLRFAAMIVVPFVRVFTKRRYSGAELVPATGGVLVAANHLSHFDPFPSAVFVWDCGRVPRFLGKSSVFKLPLIGRLLHGCGQIPVHRGTADASKALRAAVDALHKGEAVVVYPEGTLTRDPELWPMVAKTGIARLALETGVPVIPVAQWGAQDILWPYAKWMKLLPRKTIQVAAGPPVDLSQWMGAEPTAQVLRDVTDAIMRDVTLLLAGLRGETAPDKPFQRPAALEHPRKSA